VLRRLPVDFLKIDGRVIAEALSDPTAQAMIDALAAYAAHIGAFVIAEGVETQDLLALLRPGGGLTGVQGAQGYALGAPSEAVPTRAMVEAAQVAFDPRQA
jgi:EAL domain-containing protein (putative c-di-GMP-specific phosphodiesterase class I)